MENNFDEIMNIYSEDDQQQNMDKKCFAKREIRNFFSNSLFANETFVFLRETEYVDLFLVMYLGYINELVKNQMYENFNNDWKGLKIGYVISVEKMLLDNAIISKENQKEFIRKWNTSGIRQMYKISNHCSRRRSFSCNSAEVRLAFRN